MIFYTVILSVLFGIIGTAGQNTCPSTQNHVLNDVLRNLIVTRINDIRSQVAQGRFVSSSGVYARQASKMIRLAYGCDAELSAYNWAQQCFPYNSGTTTAETRYSYPGITTTNQTVLETAINAWRDEINSGILPQSSTERNIYQTYLGISNLAMMMWDSHQSVGCSVVPCTTFTQVICHFTPAGGAPGTQIYKPGPNCNRCSRIGMSTCSEAPNKVGNFGAVVTDSAEAAAIGMDGALTTDIIGDSKLSEVSERLTSLNGNRNGKSGVLAMVEVTTAGEALNGGGESSGAGAMTGVGGEIDADIIGSVMLVGRTAASGVKSVYVSGSYMP
ncbi:hypothetical protein RB195_015794 [Necator americanus]|uniref:SCP domain-containing protein n=1 Tax=Necator americanus TaxID=51031 RepID=A0ABR1E7C9_NECAM